MKRRWLRSRAPHLWPAVAAVCGLCALAGCQTTPPPRPAPICTPEEVLKRRLIEVVPLVVVSPPVDATVLALLRRNFEQQLVGSGAFEIVDGQTRSGELVLAGVVSDVGALPPRNTDRFLVGEAAEQSVDWLLRFVVEVRLKSDNHLLAVVGASLTPEQLLVQATEEEVERLLPDQRLRHSLLQAIAQVSGALAGRFGPGVSYEDPATLDVETLARQGRALYAAGAFFDAETKLRSALQRQEGEAAVAALLGDIYYARREYVRAVEMYDLAIDVQATRFRELVLLGNAHYYLRDFERAARVWEQALKVDSRSPYTRDVRANVKRARDAMRRAPRGRGLESGATPQPAQGDDEF
ncbi:MAG: tetratricopeptide repeat protein [Deltaproteobacteria bacterium]|nr:tetratricopeptide repeat protein [Deltaproteobacteria bacterium]